ncbi:MAG: PfkB family carbohydrate kinase [Polyangiaceae bacterium]
MTAHGRDFERPEWTQSWCWRRIECAESTRFENVEQGKQRQQTLWSRCAGIDRGLVAPVGPEDWLVLAPVFDELALEPWLIAAREMTGVRLAALPQGWLRRIAARQCPARVRARRRLSELVRAARRLQLTFACLCLSESEMRSEPEALPGLLELVEVLVVTRGADGAEVYVGGERLLVGVADVSPIDVTGAGDAFAGALMGALAQAAALDWALRLASAAAGLTTERVGAHALDAERVEALAEGVTIERGRPATRDRRLEP